MTDIRDDVREGFRARFEREPHGVWSSPGRVNLIGEHTDYNEGFVFPFAIDRRTVIALAPRDDDRIRLASSFSDEVVEARLADLTGERIDGWQAYPLGVAWALGQRGADLAAVPGFDVFIDSDVPVGAGLSSSAALEGSIALALDDIWRLGLDRPTLAAVGQLAENEIVGAPTGIMDQSASLLGQQDAGVFLDCRSLDAEVIPLGLEAAGLTIAVIDTHVAHAHADGGYRARRESCEQGARLMGVASLRDLAVDDLVRAREVLDDETFRRVRHIVTENQRVLDTVRALREEGPRAIGELLDASHRSMRDDFEISVPELDLAVEVAQNEGAIGARMTGGGFGGSAIALIDVDSLSRLQVAIDGAFAEHGYTGPTVFTVTPSDGAKAEQ
ncbi:galactokinase [Clavibacter michiganensis]|uniref:galactokinase n=1 Tax=Clavibacter michiganensis TaxID=28447 RepID=UPI0009A5F6D6|nr:galactokinase [Clavibacter michiganensis]KAF0259249.1 Galactokinase [Clavibacter michiganensis subsp. michiganensis]MBE3078479.1 galactokinase [Clavibacter michiganensis subsp. michiganensis]MBF4639134.1 galactokinase [Clavibacter michiganensis subsp. michiganensis]MBW8027678.1 galactokinase [Clavibacter michiganensis subsp. michiganensis]MDO4017860.1 galactokinase [Clavibacter michiganensis]